MSRTAGILLSILIGFSGAGVAMVLNTLNPAIPFNPYMFGFLAFLGSMFAEFTRKIDP